MGRYMKKASVGVLARDVVKPCADPANDVFGQHSMDFCGYGSTGLAQYECNDMGRWDVRGKNRVLHAGREGKSTVRGRTVKIRNVDGSTGLRASCTERP